MESAGPTRDLETVTSHNFKGALIESRAVGGKKDLTVTGSDLERGKKKLFKIMLHLPGPAGARTREGWRIEDNGIEEFVFAGQARQD